MGCSEPAVSKKQAEENAAMHAFEGEFPALFKRVPQSVKKSAEDVKTSPQEKKDPLMKTFRAMDSKGKLNTGMTLIAGRSLTKGEVDYQVKSFGFGSFQATVIIKDIIPDGPKS